MPASSFTGLVAAVFQKAGWKVSRPGAGEVLLVERARARKYLIEVQSASEGRADRLIPLLAQAVLQARADARELPGKPAPLAVVAAPRIRAAAAGQIEQFARDYAADTAIGMVDGEGYRLFRGPGLEGLDARPPAVRRLAVATHYTPDLFSGLNQWMLKVLLGQGLPSSMLAIPRGPFRSSAQLAAAAGVSAMSSSRMVNLLGKEGFLETDERLRIVRAGELLERWQAAHRKMPQEVPARWILRKDQKQLLTSVRRYAAASRREGAGHRARICLAVFSAADALGLGLVRGAGQHLYLERLDLGVLKELGLTLEGASQRPDVILRIPAYPEPVFRAMVQRNGVPVSDVLQVWLDVSRHPSRGREQAEQIRRRVLKPALDQVDDDGD